VFSRFFINRPIFASVLSIVIVLGGAIAWVTLPVAQYPEIAPPTVEVSAAYPGANAEVVANTVAAPIEEQVNGVEGMMYMSSQCTNDGGYTLTVTFQPGTDLNIAQILVQNRESLAEPRLPDLVKRRGISVKKKSPNVLMIINLFSKDGSRSNLDLSNYATTQIRDELSRLSGVGDVTYLGQRDYSMRLWLDPQKLASYGLIPQDVIKAVEGQNIQVAPGQIGQPPTPRGQVSQYIITTLGRLESTDQFADIVLKNDGQSLVYLKNVAEIELGAQSYDQTCTLDGKASVALSIYQLPGSNALKVAEAIKKKMRELKGRFPPGMDYAIVYDTTPFIRESINEVYETLIDAVMLVALVVLLFLQNWRSSLIPLIAVPVAVIGTFAVMAVMGFSLNNLTLFGLVLAIGIVVDDAIVVVEAVEHHIEHGLAPREASFRAMEQVSGPVIAIGLVLSAVFVPCAFITGITGQFFRQFALTIAVSTVISAFNSLTLSPALSAILLRPRKKGSFEPLPWFAFVPLGAWLGHKLGRAWAGPALAALELDLPQGTLDFLHYWGPLLFGALVGALAGLLLGRPLNALLGWLFRGFNRGFDASAAAYTRAVGGLLRVSVVVLLLYGGLLYLTYWGFTSTPTGFIPHQDKGYLLVNIQLPDAASVKRTQDVVGKIEAIALQTPGVRHTVAISGQSLLLGANASNFGSMFIMLEDFDNRPGLERAARAEAREKLREWPFNDPKALEGPQPEGLGKLEGWLGRERERLKRRADRPVPAHDHVAASLRRVARARLAAWPLSATRPLQAGEFGRLQGWFVREAERLKDQAELELSSEALTVRLQERFQKEVPRASVNIFGAPPVEGLGTVGGFKIVVLDTGDNGLAKLQKTADGVVTAGGEVPQLQGLFSSFRADTPWLELVIDRPQAKDRGVSIDDVRTTLEATLGPYYINDFNKFGRTWQVNVQAKEEFRQSPEDIRLLEVRNNRGERVPLSAFAKVKYVSGPVMVTRYNMYEAAAVHADAGPGTSSGQAIAALEGVANDKLPQSMRPEWTELALLQLQTGNTAMYVFVLAVVLVFLVLAAQYESWALPLAVILVVPMCLLFAVAGVVMAKMDINIFTQIGFLVLVGLACKNAILIVEFAKAQRERGVRSDEATLAACRLRLRPILMTSFAFILGVVPLMLSEGAGAEMRRTLGTAVFSGMLGVTLFGIFLTPVFFYVIQWVKDLRGVAPVEPLPGGPGAGRHYPAEAMPVGAPPAPPKTTHFESGPPPPGPG
jgi:multidrug efflux pump subunit AcrB